MMLQTVQTLSDTQERQGHLDLRPPLWTLGQGSDIGCPSHTMLGTVTTSSLFFSNDCL